MGSGLLLSPFYTEAQRDLSNLLSWELKSGFECRQAGFKVHQLHFVALLYGNLITYNRSIPLNIYLWKKPIMPLTWNLSVAFKILFNFQLFYYTIFWGREYLILIAYRETYFCFQTRVRLLGPTLTMRLVDGDPSGRFWISQMSRYILLFSGLLETT